MKTDTGLPASAPTPGQPKWRSILGWPSTRLGWWSVALIVTFVVLIIINSMVFMNLPEDVPWRVIVLPFYGIAMIACGLAAGIVALVAVWRRRERSGLVWLPLFLGLILIVFLLGEFLVPH